MPCWLRECGSGTLARVTTSETRVVDARGLRISYRIAGDPSAPALLLLHGLGESSASWEPLLVPLSGLGFCVLAPDARGHGETDRPGEYSMESMRDDAVAFLDALGVEAATVVGHSMGAVVAALVAVAVPSRVRRLVLEDAVPERPGGRVYPPADEPGHPVPFDWPVVNAVRAQRSDPDPAWFPAAARIAVPTLVIAGGPTSRTPQGGLHDLVDAMPDARLVEIPVGHMVHDVAPERWLATVTEFLR